MESDTKIDIVDKYITIYILCLIALSIFSLVLTSFENLSQITGNPLAVLFATVLPLLLFYGFSVFLMKYLKPE